MDECKPQHRPTRIRRECLVLEAEADEVVVDTIVYRRKFNLNAKFESSISNFSFKRLESSSMPFHRGFHRVNLHRLTIGQKHVDLHIRRNIGLKIRFSIGLCIG